MFLCWCNVKAVTKSFDRHSFYTTSLAKNNTKNNTSRSDLVMFILVLWLVNFQISTS